MSNNNPNLDRARLLLSPELMAEVNKEPFTVRGWKILERWRLLGRRASRYRPATARSLPGGICRRVKRTAPYSCSSMARVAR